MVEIFYVATIILGYANDTSLLCGRANQIHTVERINFAEILIIYWLFSKCDESVSRYWSVNVTYSLFLGIHTNTSRQLSYFFTLLILNRPTFWNLFIENRSSIRKYSLILNEIKDSSFKYSKLELGMSCIFSQQYLCNYMNKIFDFL